MVPVPIFITEPAIGEGLGLTLAYFHPSRSTRPPDDQLYGPTALRNETIARKPPPTVTGLFGGLTNNGTGALGVGHVNSFRNDTIRFTGVAAFADLFSTFYLFDQPLEFNLKGTFFNADAKFRLGGSDFFLGGGFSYLSADSSFALDRLIDVPPIIGVIGGELKDIGVLGKFLWETRDDVLYPTDGRLLDMKLTRYDQGLGGDFDYTRLDTKFLSFHPLDEDWVLGWRVQLDAVWDRPPFYGVPWVKLRGVPALRYQGEQVASLELEVRWRFHPRWGLAAFGGAGWTNSDIVGIDTSEDVFAYGVGGRYQFLPEENVWLGVDLARGPEEAVFYINIGHPW
jgi:hypothetical protein